VLECGLSIALADEDHGMVSKHEPEHVGIFILTDADISAIAQNFLKVSKNAKARKIANSGRINKVHGYSYDKKKRPPKRGLFFCVEVMRQRML
jgi:hypothetical protein